MFQIGEFWQLHSDFFTKSLRGITLDHSMIHQGKMFTASGFTDSLAPDASYVVSITTGNSGKYVHMTPALVASSANLLEVTINEGATVTGGSSVTPLNLNRNSSIVTSVVINKGVTISAAGSVEIAKFWVGAGGSPSVSRGSGSQSSDNEIILKPNTTYTLTFKNIGTVTNTTGYVSLKWYELVHE